MTIFEKLTPIGQRMFLAAIAVVIVSLGAALAAVILG